SGRRYPARARSCTAGEALGIPYSGLARTKPHRPAEKPTGPPATRQRTRNGPRQTELRLPATRVPTRQASPFAPGTRIRRGSCSHGGSGSREFLSIDATHQLLYGLDE